MTEFYGSLSADWALECLKELLLTNMQVCTARVACVDLYLLAYVCLSVVAWGGMWVPACVCQ